MKFCERAVVANSVRVGVQLHLTGTGCDSFCGCFGIGVEQRSN